MSLNNYGAHYAGLFQKYLEALDVHYKQIAALATDEVVQRGVFGDRRAVAGQAFAVCSHTKQREIESVAENIIRVMCTLASEMFAPPGLTVQIERERFKVPYSNPESFDARAVWAELLRLYSEGRGESMAYRATARSLTNAFRIDAGDELSSKCGRVVLEHPIALNAFDKPKTKLTYESRGRVVATLRALHAVALWSDVPDANQLLAGADRFDSNRGAVILRERVPVSGALHVVTYSNKFEFQFSQEFALSLQEFIGIYAPVEVDVVS